MKSQIHISYSCRHFTFKNSIFRVYLVQLMGGKGEILMDGREREIF